jgi:hypothetical protein
MAEGSSVSVHVVKLQGYIQRLEALGVPFPVYFGTDMILKTLPPRFVGFVMNYNMHAMNRSLVKLFAMLKVAEKIIWRSTNNVLLVKHGTQFKKKKSGSKKKVNDACKSTSSSEYSRGSMTSGLISIPTKSLGECLSATFLSRSRCHSLE